MALKILFVSHEVSPFAKVGGLADVAGSLPKALKAMGHDVRVLMPAYQMVLDDPTWKATPVGEPFNVAINPIDSKMATLHETKLPGSDVPVWLLGTDEWFTETVSSQTVYLPGSSQHIFFSKATLALCKETDWIPDVIHCNDWHTGMIPVLMRESGDRTWDTVASVFTIHNLAYQGEFGSDVLDQLGLPQSLFNMYQLETFGAVNFLKSGCVYADQVTTVSPQYAAEIQTDQFGCKLEGVMNFLREKGRLSGILNGIDQDVFNPETDPKIAAHFSRNDLAGKEKCRTALMEELHMAQIPNAPLIGVVSRLDHQKGMDMLLEVADRLFLCPMQLIVQGLGDENLAQRFRSLADRFPYHFRFVERFDADLAQKIYAGADMFAMPSTFEPCGLGQLIAMRYGTVPIVRATGGLANTVTEGQTGFVFNENDSQALLATCRRAGFAYGHQEAWQGLMRSAMSYNSSWSRSATAYSQIYEHISAARNIGGPAVPDQPVLEQVEA